MINVYFLQHRRNFTPLLEHFAKKIKPENKQLLKFYFLTTYPIEIKFNTGIQYEQIHFGGNVDTNNYQQKFNWAVKQDCEYFFKLDEDIIFSNHVWDYIVENREIVKQPKVMTLSPTINIGVPTIDLFIERFCPELKKEIEQAFLKIDIQKTAGTRWDMDLEHLNDFTIRAKQWNRHAFHERLKIMNTNIKGIHPIRFDDDLQSCMMNVVLRNIYKFTSPQIMNTITINCPYLVNDVCLYETEKIRQVQKDVGFDPYDEISMNKYSFDHKLDHVYILGAFALHSYFGFVESGGGLFSKNEQFIHDTILSKVKEIEHFGLA